MIDVHAPEGPTHSWRDFLLHIATICVGLLIAIGLEQTVEAVHRAHERRDLREELAHESEQMLKDSESCYKASFRKTNESSSLLQTMSQAGHDNKPLSSWPMPSNDEGMLPSDPIFRGATASNRLSLLTRQEVEAFSELHLLVQDVEQHMGKQNDANLNVNVAMGSMTFGALTPADILAHTRENLRPAYAALIGLQTAYYRSGISCYTLHAAAEASAHGERDLEKIEAAETAAHTRLYTRIRSAMEKSMQDTPPPAKR